MPQAHEHSDFVHQLGGATAIVGLVQKKMKVVITPQAVSNWLLRGVPWYMRPLLIEEARRLKIELPNGFRRRGA